jgi:hypothetical protein
MAAEAQISPVHDPTYQSFDFSSLLNQAQQPLAALNQGRLAIAQQQNARAFEQQQAVQQANLQQRNRLAEMTQGAQLSEAERLKIQNENDQIKYAQAGVTPQPGESRAQTLQRAQQAQDEKRFQAFKGVSDSAADAHQQLEDMIKKSGLVIQPGFDQAKAQILNDPSLAPLLTRHGGILGAPAGDAVRQAIMGAGSIQDINKVLSDYPNAAADRATVLSALQNANTTLAQRNHDNAVLQLGQQAQYLQSRFNINNEMAGNFFRDPNASPELQAKMANYHLQNVGPQPTPGLALPTPSPVSINTNLVQPTSQAPPGPQNPYEAHYAVLAEQQGHQQAAAAADSALQDAQQQKAAILAKLQPTALATQYGGSPVNTGFATGSAIGNRPYSTEEKLALGKQLNQVQAQIDKLTAQKQQHVDAINGLVIPPDPATQIVPATNAAPNQISPGTNTLAAPQAFPATNGYTAPTQFNQNPFATPGQQPLQLLPPNQIGRPQPTQPTNAITPSPQQPILPGGLQSPGAMNQPQGQQQNPLLQQAITQKVHALLGTDDPQKLAQIKSYVSSVGIQPAQAQQLIGAALQGDQQSAMKVRMLAQQALNSGIGGDTSQPQGFSQLAGANPLSGV